MCESCFKMWWVKSALIAGIPLSVIENKTKLFDHFNKNFIDYERDLRNSCKYLDDTRSCEACMEYYS